VTKLQTAARCTALVQFGLKEQINSLQRRLKVQSEELEAAYTEVEQQESHNAVQDCDDPELAAELASELAELMNELEVTQRERDEARAELAASQAGKSPAHPDPPPSGQVNALALNTP
jgi:multidrug resistance efflux pump